MVIGFMLPEFAGATEKSVRFMSRETFQAVHETRQRGKYSCLLTDTVFRELGSRVRKGASSRGCTKHMKMVWHDRVGKQIAFATVQVVQIMIRT